VTNNIVTVLEDLSHDLGIAVITPEYEIMLILLQHGPQTTDDLFEHSRLSRSGFFHAMNRLKHRGWVEGDTSVRDRRSRIYQLSAPISDQVVANVREYRAIAHLGVPPAPVPGRTFERLHLHLGEQRLPHLTCEFQTLLYLYFNPGATSHKVARHVTVSETRFYAALRNLFELELVIFTRTDDDKRRKCYALTPWVAEALARTSKRAVNWVEQLDRNHPVGQISGEGEAA